MESETKNQINNDYYNKFFYETMCHVCKRFGGGVHLKSCGGCKMISYCGQEHQKLHWKHHKPLCKAIQDALQEYGFNDRGKDSKDCDERKLIFMMLVLRKLGRHLKKDETQMLIFPRECLVCHEKNNKLLEDCQKCAASFCENHKDDTEHRDICASLELGLRSDLLTITEFNSHPELFPDLKHISDASTCQNMKDFIYASGNTVVYREYSRIQSVDSAISDDILVAERSQYLTRPLTLLYAMRLLNFVPKRNKDLVIHVVGANYNEVVTLFSWQVLLELMETVMSVMVIMIGPALRDKCDPSRTSNFCLLLENKSLFFEYHYVLYENYVLDLSFVKPDLIVGFNFGNEGHELEFNKETWAPFIDALGKQNCPVVLTSATLQDFEKETDRINTILRRQVDYIFREKNPFASLRPHRVLGPERVYYENQYVIIYRSLCS